MDNKPTQDALSGLSRMLVQAGRLAPGEAADLLQLAQDKQSSFVDTLLATGLLTSAELAHTLSAALALPLLDLDAVDLQIGAAVPTNRDLLQEIGHPRHGMALEEVFTGNPRGRPHD